MHLKSSYAADRPEENGGLRAIEADELNVRMQR
jgi:hypothetical protein